MSVGSFEDRRDSIAAGGKRMVCPYCGSPDTRRTAEFGPFHMTEQYHCRACKSPFALLRWEEEAGGASATDRTPETPPSPKRPPDSTDS